MSNLEIIICLILSDEQISILVGGFEYQPDKIAPETLGLVQMSGKRMAGTQE